MGDAAVRQAPPRLPTTNIPVDLTDLEVIDPVSTGYARSREAAQQYHGIQQDIESVCDFPALVRDPKSVGWIHRNSGGQSYGTTRAALHYLRSAMECT
jgi:carboxypeptidase C (cathepsin A)